MRYCDYLDTPIGLLYIEADETAILKVNVLKEIKEVNPNSLTDLCKFELTEYFRGQRQSFTVPIKLNGTAFQQKVWNTLHELPFGCTCSYSDLAKKLGKPNSTRAIGNVLHINPLLIIVPCHRVIAKNGQIGGFAYGLEQKKYLLEHEKNCL